MIGKSLRKIIQKLLLIFCILKKKKYFQDSKRRKKRMALSCNKKIICIITEKTSKGAFYCLNCLNSFRTENKLNSHEKVCKNNDFCGIVLPTGKNEILKFHQYIQSDKMPYIIYTDIESLIKKNRWTCK